MDEYLSELMETGMSLMIYRDGVMLFSSRNNGIRPHLEAIESLGREALRGTIMVDKIVGRAAALLILYAGASEVHCLTVSYGGKELLKESGVRLEFKRETPFINVQDGVIICPFERMVQGISDPSEAYEKIVAKIAEMR